MAFIVNCAQCKKSFEAKTRAQKFDTKECELAHRQANRSAFFSPTLLVVKCVQCGKDFTTKSKKQQVCSKDCLLQQQLADAATPKQSKQTGAWTPFNGNHLPPKKETNNDAAIDTLTDFLNAIDTLGGVVKCDENTYTLAAYDECYSLADSYMKACKLLERLPKVTDHTMKEHRDCVICGAITANKCVMSCKHREHVCNECKHLSPHTLCPKCDEEKIAMQVA